MLADRSTATATGPAGPVTWNAAARSPANATGQSKTTRSSLTSDRWAVPSPTVAPNTFGAGWTIVYAGPRANAPLPAPAPPSFTPDVLTIVSSSSTSRRSVPPPVPVFTWTSMARGSAVVCM